VQGNLSNPLIIKNWKYSFKLSQHLIRIIVHVIQMACGLLSRAILLACGFYGADHGICKATFGYHDDYVPFRDVVFPQLELSDDLEIFKALKSTDQSTVTTG
jgi:hypothetical protein